MATPPSLEACGPKKASRAVPVFFADIRGTASPCRQAAGRDRVDRPATISATDITVHGALQWKRPHLALPVPWA